MRKKKMKANERTGLSQLRSQRLRKRYKSRTVVQTSRSMSPAARS